jgi:hypothetical protein
LEVFMRTALALAVLALASPALADPPAAPAPIPAAAPAPALTPDAFVQLDVAGRREALAKLSKAEQTALFKALTPSQLLGLAQKSLSAMNEYQGELTKQERVDGDIQAPQTLEVGIREKPYAIRIKVIAGPPKGRRCLYNPAVKKGEVRARESGFKGIVGAVWIDMNGSLAKGDTNHVISDTGFGHTLQIVQGDIAASASAGGLTRVDEGFDPRGLYCMKVTAPKGVKTYAVKSRLCFDPVLGLPLSVEVDDAKGFLERFNWAKVKPHAFTDADFTPDGFDL